MDRIYVMELVQAVQTGKLSRREFTRRAALAVGSLASANLLLAACQPITADRPPVVMEIGAADSLEHKRSQTEDNVGTHTTTNNEVVELSAEGVTHLRYFTGPDGETHFGEVSVDFAPVEMPVGPPVDFSPFTPAKHLFFLHLPVGYSHDWLPVSSRILWCSIFGEMEVTVSDGESRRIPAGSVFLAEDTTGKGHQARVVGDSDVLLLGVEVAE